MGDIGAVGPAGGTFAVGGLGQAAASRTIEGSYPSTSGGAVSITAPTSWTVTFSHAGHGQAVYVTSAG